MQLLEQRKHVWNTFYDENSGLNRLIIGRFSQDMPVEPLRQKRFFQERLEWSYAQYMKQLEFADYIQDDSMPHLSMLTGTEIFAEAFGCKVYDSETNHSCAIPMVHNAADAAKVKKPEVMQSSITVWLEMADKLRERAGKDALLGLPDIQSPMDIVAILWDKTDFYTAIYESPEVVLELASMVMDFLCEFLDIWFARYGKDFVSHYPDYYMPYGMTLSEDEVGAVSSSMFREFFERELWALSERYGAIGIHCCANARHQWENFKNIPGLKALNLVQPFDTLLEAYNYFPKNIAQYHTIDKTQIYDLFSDKVPQDAKIIASTWYSVDSRAEARDIVKRCRELQQNMMR